MRGFMLGWRYMIGRGSLCSLARYDRCGAYALVRYMLGCVMFMLDWRVYDRCVELMLVRRVIYGRANSMG